ncbi:MAG: ABC transporter permease [Desulfobulbaceae bacterium]|nr:ABC transporter permease [Desulfobulbaceae bacterium]
MKKNVRIPAVSLTQSIAGSFSRSCTFTWYPVYLREMLLFKRKLLKVGYVFSAMVTPIIYLLVFGYGLGRNVKMDGTDYLSFLIPGLVAMSSMNNSYAWVASALNLNRIYFKTFQVLVQAPIPSSSIMLGEVLAGMTKGLFASSLIILVGLISPAHFRISPLFVTALILNCFMFASLGVITGMLAKSHEDASTYNNFIIMPMSFFSGTFFPVDTMPAILRVIINIMPLTHTNILIRAQILDSRALLALVVMVVYGLIFFAIGSRLINRYSE